MARMKAVRAESVWAALGGVLVGYVLWLIAISIGDFFTTAGMWGPIVLAVAVVFAPGRHAVGTTACGRREIAPWRRSRSRCRCSRCCCRLLVVADSYL